MVGLRPADQHRQFGDITAAVFQTDDVWVDRQVDHQLWTQVHTWDDSSFRGKTIVISIQLELLTSTAVRTHFDALKSWYHKPTELERDAIN